MRPAYIEYERGSNEEILFRNYGYEGWLVVKLVDGARFYGHFCERIDTMNLRHGQLSIDGLEPGTMPADFIPHRLRDVYPVMVDDAVRMAYNLGREMDL